MSKIANGLVLFSLLLALSLGVAFAGEEPAANDTVNGNVTNESINNTNETALNNTTIEAPLNTPAAETKP